MWLFRGQGKREQSTMDTSMSDGAAQKIAGFGIKMQRRFAEGLNKRFINMNTKKLKVFLALFCITVGGYSAILTLNAINGSKEKQSGFKIGHIDVPKHFHKTGDEVETQTYVDDGTFYKIQGFKKYMDSLMQYKPYQHDSILQVRPHLMDSVLVLEKLYYSQKQK
ncbi:MAG: hypothetical protein WKF91_21820 [Segetibacter sp.]